MGKGAAPTELEEEVAKALFDIEVSPSSEIKADLRDVQICSAKELEVKQGRTALIIHFPFRVWKNVSAQSWTRTFAVRASRSGHAHARSLQCTNPFSRTSSLQLRLLARGHASVWMAQSS